MSYTCFFPEANCCGIWRFQTDEPELIKRLQHRVHQDGSPWRIAGRGDVWVFSRSFKNSTNARKHLERTLAKLSSNCFEIQPLRGWKGWEVVRPSDEIKTHSS